MFRVDQEADLDRSWKVLEDVSAWLRIWSLGSHIYTLLYIYSLYTTLNPIPHLQPVNKDNIVTPD